MIFLYKLSESLSKFALRLAGIIMVYMVLHIVFEIALRAFFSSSTYVLDEFVAYATAAVTFLAMPHAMRKGSLIRVGIVLNRLRGIPRLIIEVFGLSVTLLVSWFIIYFFWIKIFWRDIIRGRVSNSIAEIPLWIPEVFVILGLVLFSFQVLVMLLKIVFEGMDDYSKIEMTD
jgi:TRAP-type C4-dicarboxylate transport system permease small subunit